ncbi:uncharacterized protein N7473_002030 [Penicillium subrubescens]|uniref:uncharacterized protein n=1 Tax=Penicillium subrubescens TaxID=1316194 RepID=UPI0025455402|nr:uncharacterized protein N7473_002030 [Penicillium subrubescens]KAJ5905114.1 hypothetical protein N7473_002030 [Penicillium subrubescens]
MVEDAPIVFSVGMSFSLAVAIVIFCSVSAQRTSFIRPRNPLNDGEGRESDYLELWAWQYLQQGRG